MLPNTPNQTIDIFVTGGDPVQGVNFRVQLADGFPDVPGSTVLVQRELESSRTVAILWNGIWNGLLIRGTSPPNPLGFFASCQNRREGCVAGFDNATFDFGPDAALGLLPSSALSSDQVFVS